MNILRKSWAFLVRDFRSQTSYRLAFIMNIAGIFFSIAIFFFISRLLGRAVNPFLAQYGGNYFAFVLVGLAVSGFMGTSLGVFSSTISSAQAQGTLEVMLVTPTKLPEIICMSSIWSFLFTSLNILIYLVIGVMVFGLKLAGANVAAALVVLFLIVTIFSGLGIISASFIMVLKRGDPISWLFGSVSAIMSGTFFPVQVLPGWLQKYSIFFPLFYGLRAMRLALLKAASLSVLAPDILALAVFVAVIIPLSFLAFRYAVGRAKIDGSLATY
jgi:ABC-2 type transport system permease protein